MGPTSPREGNVGQGFFGGSLAMKFLVVGVNFLVRMNCDLVGYVSSPVVVGCEALPLELLLSVCEGRWCLTHHNSMWSVDPPIGYSIPSVATLLMVIESRAPPICSNNCSFPRFLNLYPVVFHDRVAP
ncbi:hypothetical protein GOP47_0027193 [Adiantum capillus-veneris]|nr:hypothetical protein GOP47_0027193 [Adiantum capillus-veneris]